MTNFAACRSKRSSSGKHNLSRRHGSTTLTSVSNPKTVFICRHPLLENATKSRSTCSSSFIFSNHSSSTLGSNLTLNTHHPNRHKLDFGYQTPQWQYMDDNEEINLKKCNQNKCGLCKERINFFKQVYMCGHAFHGECIWRFSSLNSNYDTKLCPRNCSQRQATFECNKHKQFISSGDSSNSNGNLDIGRKSLRSISTTSSSNSGSLL